MEVKKWQEAKRWLTRPKVSPKERADVLQWIDYNNGKFGTEEQAKEYKKKYATAPNKYDESESPSYVEPAEMEDIKKGLQVSPMVKKPKKEIIKKVVEKPKPPAPRPWQFAPWFDYPEDDDAPPPEDIEKVLNIKKKEVAGLEALLRLHKFVG